MFRLLVNLMITSMIFFPEKAFYEKPEDYGLVHEDVWLETREGLRLHGWYLKAPEARGAVLFLHGNAGNISGRIFKAEGWVGRGFSVLLLDYRGYGRSEGAIQHQEDVVQDAALALDWLVKEKNIPLSRIILYGESLGTHPAIRLAVEHKTAGLVLEAPYTSFVELGRKHYPFVPSSLIKDFAFPNIDYIEKVRCPVFILHGTEDEICPYAMAGELFEAAPLPKEIFTITGGVHNDLPMRAGDDYWQKAYDFVMKYFSAEEKRI